MKSFRNIFALAAGALFSLGLGLGGMTDPNKVLGFLDILGNWDPSLVFVMGGAIAVFAPVFRWLSPRKASLFGDVLQLPTRSVVDARLLIGAAMFGAGWGLAGYCPGPALVGTMTLGRDVLVLTASMLIGMAVFSIVETRRS